MGQPPLLVECGTVSDDKARDILKDLTIRDTCGSRVVDRVGRRGWSRPRVCVSPRIFRQYRVGDPWDPGSEDHQNPIGLGPVSLRLGEKRRKPAPHLTPKEPRKKEAPPPLEPRVPVAKPPPVQPVAPRVPQENQETAHLAEVAAQKRKEAEAARSWPRRTVTPVYAATEAGQGKKPPLAPLPVRPEARDAHEKETDGSAMSGQDGRQKGGRARFRMKPTDVTRAPVTRAIEPATDGGTAEVPPPRAAPAMPVSGGLDDLFGAAAQQGRLRMDQGPAVEAEE